MRYSPIAAGRGSSSSGNRRVLDDPDLAAAHLVMLASGDITNRTFYGAVPMPAKELHRVADAGVRAFLRAYRD